MIEGPQALLSRAAQQRRRGRTAVLTAALAFVALQAAYYFPLTTLCPQLFDVEYANKLASLRAKLAVKPAEQPLVLGLGTSLTALALRPDALVETEPADARHPLVFNFGINNTNIIMHLLCLQRLVREEGIRPDWVVLDIWPGFFTFDKHERPLHPAIERLTRRDIRTVARYHKNPHELRQEWRAVQWCPWYTRRHRLQSWLLPRWVPEDKRVDHLWRYTDAWGWDHFPAYIEHCKQLYPRDPAYLNGIAQSMKTWSQRAITEDLHGALVELIELCAQEKIGIVLMWLPEASQYRNGYTPAYRERIRRWHARLTEETGVPIVDARTWVADDGFVEGHHTNPEGATVYTRRFEQEVLHRIAAGTMPRPHAPPPRYEAGKN